MFRRFFRHINEGLQGVIRHFAMSISSATAVTVTLILIIVFLVFTSNLQEITKNIENSINITATVKFEAEGKDNIQRIENDLKRIAGVKEVKYHTKQQEYEYFLSNYQNEQKALFESYSGENPFKDAFLIEIYDGKQIGTINNKIKQIDGIFSSEYGGLSSQRLIELLDNVRVGGLVLVISLCLLAIYLVYNTIKITISARADEIWIMRNVGAKNGYVRAPFLVEGIVIGMMGAIIPMALGTFGYAYIYRVTGGYIGAKILPLIEPYPYILYIAAIALGIGLVVGFIGSYLSVCKYLRIKR